MRRFFSRHAHNKITEIVEKLCKDDTISNLVFVPYKMGSMFSTKDKMLSFLTYTEVIKFACASCHAGYMVKTA